MTENLSPLKQAFLAIEDLQAKLEAAQRDGAASREPIAVIGMGCRMPGSANDPAAFWEALKNGVDGIRDIPTDRWDAAALYDADPDAPGKSYIRQAGFIDNVDGFDPQFFGIAPREAHSMDPQQRLLLEVAWEALEHAAIAPDSLNGTRTGVFVGIASMDYATRFYKTNDPTRLDTYFASGISHSIASGRLAYILGLQGPAVSLDTACSSSLLATHLAVQSLRTRDSDLALAAGVNLILLPDNQISFSRLRMLAADGRCKTFDARADGFGDGEGCGVVVLKRLADAQRDGDRILAVILGSAANQDGASSGLTAPNGPAQEAVIRAALRNGSVSPAEVGYIEAHGTGTSLGDPIEVRALANVLRDGRPASQPFYLGSVKANIGHLEAGAGITGLIKAILTLEHAQIPPQINFETPNPLLAWDEIPAVIPTQLTAWPQGYARRVAGVSAFGFSGTNVHVVLAEAPHQPQLAQSTLPERPRHLLALSARTPSALHDLAATYADFLASSDAPFADISFTANTGRARLPARLALHAADASEARAKLDEYLTTGEAAGFAQGFVESNDPPKIAFLFTGQGAQYAGMGKTLFTNQPVFRAALERCAQIYRAQTGDSLLDLLYPPSGDPGDAIHQTANTQPALFAVEYALAQMWLAWGITPAAVAGHSLGEYVAAVIAGVFSLEDGLKLVTARGRLMGALPAGGAMSAINAPLDVVEAAIQETDAAAQHVSIAAVNGPDSIVISGDQDAVQQVAAHFQERGVRVTALKVSHAFHSHRVAPMLDEFERIAASVTYSQPKIRLISDVTGEIARGAQVASPRYWREHVQQPVQFMRAIQTLYREGCDIFLEVGPHPTLTGMGQRVLADPDRVITWAGSLKRDQDDWSQLLTSFAILYAAGAPVDFAALDATYARNKLALPTYPFQRARYWVDLTPAAPAGSAATRLAASLIHPLLGEKLRSPAKTITFKNELSTPAFSFLDHHRVFENAILPATGFLELSLAAGLEYFGAVPYQIEDVAIHTALNVADGETRLLQAILTPGDPAATLEIYTQGELGDPWLLHASAALVPAASPEPLPAVDLAAVQARCAEVIPAESHYAHLAANGLIFGESLLGVEQIWRTDGEALGRIQPTRAVETETGYILHPALLDAHLQIVAAALPLGEDTYLPIHFDRIRLLQAGMPCWSHVTIAKISAETITASVTLLDDDGIPVLEIGAMTLKRADRASLRRSVKPAFSDWLYQQTWQPVASLAPGALTTTTISPRAMAHKLDPALEQLYTSNGLDEYVTDLLPEFDRLTRIYILNAFLKLGWRPQIGQRFTAAELAAQLNIIPQHHRLIGYLLSILAEDGYLATDGDTWHVLRVPQSEDARSLLASLIQVFPNYAAELEVTGRCGAQFAEALTGSADPLQLIFPGGSLDTAERIYQKSPAALTYNGLIRTAVQDIVSQRAAQGNTQGLRVLEIGAGTGGTTSFVLPVLPKGSEYTFTDISPLFTARAQIKFADFPFVRFQPLDIEQDPQNQGLTGHHFDLIIAANVIHATQDLRTTLRHVRSLLAPDGVFIMLEVTAPQRWVDITFGLTDGWWRFTDRDLRPAYPLLSRPQWIELLECNEFAEAATIPQVQGTTQETTIEEAVIIARAAVEEQETWLIVGRPEDALPAALAENLQQRGATTALLDTANLPAVFAETDSPGQIVFLAGASDDTRNLLQLTQAILSANFAAPPRLWIVTRGAQPAGDFRSPDPAQAELWGFARSLALEHPELSCTRLDLDPSNPDPLSALLAELTNPAPHTENEIALRRDQRLVNRLEHFTLPISDDRPLALSQTRPGQLDSLEWQPAERQKPGPGQLEIEVQATALNFKDLMILLQMAPDAPLGMECSGVVSALGEGVTGFAIGDPVMAIAAGSFARYTLADAAFTARVPASLSMTQAAAQLVAHITAAYALNNLAHIKSGATVLIHAGAGGVGLAAIQIAQRAGATIFATAGSDAKRATLRGLGVPHVLDSRSLDFAPEIMRLTDGRGVDIALNSLAGDFIPATLGVMAAGGRFLEIGKSGLLTPDEAATRYPGLHYHIIDWTEQAQHDPGIIVAILQAYITDLASGAAKPLPVQLYDADDVQSAFRCMQQARHTGKIVVQQPRSSTAPITRPDATYLVTGGLGALGLLSAEWLAEQGACHLALLGRSQPAPEVLDRLAKLESGGVQVLALQADVASEDELRAAFQRIQQSMPPLRGIIHSAGLLDDAALSNQTWQRFETVYAPKVKGADLLHRLSLELKLPLDFFVLYSSIASIFGSRGQVNHAAANAHMDALAHSRHASGLPALSINWGVWSEIGAAAERGAVQRSAGQGLQSFTPAEGLVVLEALMRSQAVQVTVNPMDWPLYLQSFGEDVPPYLRDLAAESTRVSAKAAARKPQEDKPGAPGRRTFIQDLNDAPADRRRSLLLNFVQTQAARVLGLDTRAVLEHTPLSEMGLDSLMAVELRNTLGKALELQRPLPVTMVFDYPTITAMRDYLFSEVLHLQETAPSLPAASAAPEAPGGSAMLENIEDLSDDDVDRILAEMNKGKK